MQIELRFSSRRQTRRTLTRRLALLNVVSHWAALLTTKLCTPRTSPVQDIANFLLVRGPYAFLGHGWLGCSQQYQFPDALNADYGVPAGLCAETAPNSSVFTRDFSKSTVTMDCNAWKPTITMK